jgi:nucleoporin POM34
MSSTALAPVKPAQSLIASSNQTTKQSAPNATPQKAPASPQIVRSTPQSLRESGRWLHPRMDEVIQRRNKTNFDNSNIKAISVNVGCIVAAIVTLSAVEKKYG